MLAGTRGGNVALYDLRSSKPLYIKEHQYGLPIHTVQFHEGSGTALSGDPKLVKIWNAQGSAVGTAGGRDDDPRFGGGAEGPGLNGALGSIVANVEGTADFSHFITSGDATDPSGESNGLLLCAGEQSKVQSFYCPVLGPAPKWCSFLDNITEELEEKDLNGAAAGGDAAGAVQTETIYEDYKFLTRSEIDTLGIQNLVGTPLLRGYMHGFFIHVGLYNRIRAVAKPFEYNEYRTQKIKERMEDKRASRIAPKAAAKKAQAQVNPDLAERLQAKAADRTKAGKVARALVEDDRFGGLFSNPDFHIDQEAEDFKLRNPSGISAKKVRNDRDMDSDHEEDSEEERGEGVGGSGFSRVANAEVDERWDNGSDGDTREDEEFHESDSDEDGFKGGKIRGEAETTQIPKEKKHTKKEAKKRKKAKKKATKNIMYEADDYMNNGAEAVDIGLGNLSTEAEAHKRKKELSLSVAERLQLQTAQARFTGEAKRHRVTGRGSEKEVTFVPRASKKKEDEAQREEAAQDDRGGRSRRGVKGLGFKTPFKHHAS